MANYIIIGGDGKEYGPVSDVDVRQWIAEGRLAASSLAKAESDAEFRPLALFPEFAATFGVNAPAPSVPPVFSTVNSNAANAVVLEQVKAPAVGLKITAVINFVLAFWSMMELIFSHPAVEDLYAAYPQFRDPMVQKWLHLAYGPLGIGSDLFGMAMSVLVFIGARKMQALKNYEFAFVAALLALLPCVTPCCLLGLPFGIWALVVLNKTEVKSQFN